MNTDGTIPLAGVLRVTYFLGLGIFLIVFAISTIGNVYEPPGEDEESVPDSLRGLVIDQERDDYNRDLGVIYSLLGSATIATALAGFRRELNWIRSGMLFGGVVVVFFGLGYAGSGSSAWLVSIWSLVALSVLAACARYVETGGTLAEIVTRRVASRPSDAP